MPREPEAAPCTCGASAQQFLQLALHSIDPAPSLLPPIILSRRFVLVVYYSRLCISLFVINQDSSLARTTRQISYHYSKDGRRHGNDNGTVAEVIEEGVVGQGKKCGAGYEEGANVAGTELGNDVRWRDGTIRRTARAGRQLPLPLAIVVREHIRVHSARAVGEGLATCVDICFGRSDARKGLMAK